MKRNHLEISINPIKAKEQVVLSSFVAVQPTKWGENDRRQQDMTDSVVKFLCNSLQPLSRVEDPAFKELLHKAQPAYTLPSRKHLSTKILPEKTRRLHDDICEQLTDVSAMCLTIDIWSNRTMKAYIGITGHYIKDFKMQSVMLACRRFKGSRTAENILSMYQQVTDSFNLDGKITSIVTDNASNMTKAFQHPDCESDSESDSEDEDLDIVIKTANRIVGFYLIYKRVNEIR